MQNEQYKKLKSIDVSPYLEKKGQFHYLSWAHAVDLLLQNDPSGTWEFLEPKTFGDTMMIYCKVYAFGKAQVMHLPVMDYKNNAQPNPDARDVSDTMMRCLVKCIATFGIGLNVYAGEDLPDESKGKNNVNQNRNASSQKPIVSTARITKSVTQPNSYGNGGFAENDVPDFPSESTTDFIPPRQNGEFVINFGNRYNGKKIKDIPFEELDEYANVCTEHSNKTGKPVPDGFNEFLKALYGN